jgi:hypothetical protein
VKNENRIALGILLLGLIGIVIYWFMPMQTGGEESSPVRSDQEERVILPQHALSRYHEIEEVKAYLEDIKALIKEGKAVLPLLEDELDSESRRVQQILLRDPEFLSDTRSGDTLLHNDMMRILPAISSTLDTDTQRVCQKHRCYQAKKYNFATNTTTRAIVDLDDQKVLKVERFGNMQPDISLRLRRIAEAIALKSPEVSRELGHTPLRNEITMANVRGSMKESPCEDTTHLCVAPTFADHQKARALWAVVDLTDMRLAAAKWAGLGKTATPACISERTLQNRYIMKHFCQKDTILEKNGWHIVYRLTGSDGLEIRDVRIKGKPVLKSAKIVDWHVSYKQEGADRLDTTTQSYIEGRRVEFVRGEDNSYMFGYNDAMGCPMFSTSVVLPFNGPQIRPLHGGNGFMLTQDFRNPKWPMACNYRYENRFEFYDDGSFRIVGVNKGRGCGDHALYRPVMRIDTAMGERERFWKRHDGKWKVVPKEFSEAVPDTPRYPYKVTGANNEESGYLIEPNHGQFGDGSRGDHATLFVTRYHPGEGDTDLLTLGSCCKLDEEGVERYLNGESIDGTDIVIWYVPHIHNDARKGHEYCWADTVIGEDGNLKVQVWPCSVGPKFVPITKE